jgi:hypothetical protein
MPLTGRFTFRRSLGGKIVLQVEEEVKSLWPARRRAFKKRWRDARLMDLAAPELRALIDLRYKPQFMAQYEYLAPDAPQQQTLTSDESPQGRPRLVDEGAPVLRSDADPSRDRTAVEVDRSAPRLRQAR